MENRPFGDPKVPPELADIHEMMSQIHLEERSSFAAELRSELVQEYNRSGEEDRRPSRTVMVAAAAVVFLVGASVSVSPVGASLARFFTSTPLAEVGDGPVALQEPFIPVTATADYDKPSAVAAPTPRPEALPFWAEAEPSTFPSLSDREGALRIVQDEFPEALFALGIGGTVTVNMWVRNDGTVERPTVRHTSGIPDLDMAALRATRTLRFNPATRAGTPVGTWVEFDITFRAESRQAMGAEAQSTLVLPPSR